MSSKGGAREFTVETEFQRKVRRPGGVTRHQAIGRASAQIDTLKDEFGDWLNSEMQRLDAAILRLGGNPANPASMDDAYRSSRQLRDVGTTMGYELLTFVARSLCEVLDAIRNGARYDQELIDCHTDALHLARKDSYKNVSPSRVPDLCDGLQRATERSLKAADRAPE
jgi:chemotaxis protein histidine kinase CheA